jgi:outer membrane receptor protein involved in Fe transport
MKRSTVSVLTLSAAALAHSAAGIAQEATLEEIIVTAQKREQRLIDVPVSITALSGQELEQRGLSSIQDISFAVPGMAMREDGPGSYTIFMRGLSNQYGSDALVGVYLDEAPLSLTGFDQLDARVMDLERVEVLKGPQGTLYGQGSVAGAVRYITKDPVLESFEGKVEASQAYVDDGDTKEALTGIVNVPMGESFAVRLAGTVERGGGWQDQPQAGIEDGNNQDLENFRAKALWRITDAFDAQLMVVLHRNESELGLGYENPDRTITVGVDRARVLVPKEFEYDLYNLDLTYDFGGVQLLSSTTYIDHRHQYPFSYIGGPETVYEGALEGTDERHTRAHQFTQEVRLGSTGEGPLNWTAGAFYRSLGHQLTAVYDTLFDGVVFPYAFYLDANEYESYAIFADASYDLTEKLELGVGVRYFEDDQTTFDGTLTETDSFDSTDPRIYMSYKFTPDLNVYASAAKGFRSGGFNRGELPNYEPESLWSYELGVKGQSAGGVFGFEAAVYYSDYSDMLRRGLVFVEETTTFESLTTNIGKVEVKGVEGGFTWRPTPALALNATAAYIDSEITEVNATDATSLAGDPVDYVPEFSYTAGVHYSFAWTALLPGYVRVDYSYRDAVTYVDRTSFPPENLPQTADEIGLLDARLGLEWGKASFELFGTNLTNENKWIDPYHQWTNANRTRPRAIGLKAAYNFK